MHQLAMQQKIIAQARPLQNPLRLITLAMRYHFRQLADIRRCRDLGDDELPREPRHCFEQLSKRRLYQEFGQ